MRIFEHLVKWSLKLWSLQRIRDNVNGMPCYFSRTLPKLASYTTVVNGIGIFGSELLVVKKLKHKER